MQENDIKPNLWDLLEVVGILSFWRMCFWDGSGLPASYVLKSKNCPIFFDHISILNIVR